MKKAILFILIACSLGLFTGCEETDNTKWVSSSETFGEDWLNAIDDADKYAGNVIGYYVDEVMYPKEYMIYAEDTDAWITIKADKVDTKISSVNDLVQVPAYIYTKKVGGGKIEVVAIVCYYDDMIKVE